jgi:hypothetical protein
MSTLAEQLFTKKIVVGDPAARSYLFCVGPTSLQSAILGQLWKKATAYMDHWDAWVQQQNFPAGILRCGRAGGEGA